MFEPSPSCRPSPVRTVLLIAGLLLGGLPPATLADTAVVPTDYPTVQAAIDAVQGTVGALVRIDSNDTFAESVVVTQSAVIEGGAGFSPALYAVDGVFTAAGTRVLTLRNLRFALPPFLVCAITIENRLATVTVVLEHLTVDTAAVLNAGGLNAYGGPSGVTDIAILDCLFRVAGNKAAVDAEDTSSVTILRSLFDVRSGATGVHLDSLQTTIADCRFLLQPEGSEATGLVLEADLVPGGASFHVERNEFVRLGEGSASGILMTPGDPATYVATDNVLRDLTSGIFISLASPFTLLARLVNNTIHGTSGDAVSVAATGGSTVDVELTNNLLTGSGGWGVSSQVAGSTLRISSSYNGFFGNALGDVEPPYSSSNDLLADPRYLSNANLRLGSGSPALDRGFNGVAELPATDHLGNPRIQNGTVDLGAYEGAVPAAIAVPTLGGVGMGLFAVVLGALGLWIARRRRAGTAGLLALLTLGATVARADTAVVPTDYATVQAAINAVQGTAGALVRIDSNATFEETVVISQSVRIEAGVGATPTLEGADTECTFDVAGSCTLNLSPAGATDTLVTVVGLRLTSSPAAGAGDRIAQLYNQGSGVARLELERVTLDDRDGGSTGVAAASAANGPIRLALRDATVRLGGSAEVFGVRLGAQSEVTIDRSTFILDGPTNVAVRAEDAEVEIRDSAFEIAATEFEGTSCFLRLNESRFTLERNRLHARVASGAGVLGIVHTGLGGRGGSSVVANVFSREGEGEGETGVLLAPGATGELTLYLADNLFRGLATAIALAPEAGGGIVPGGVAMALLVNNSFDGSTRDAITLSSPERARSSLTLLNNLITRATDFAVGLRETAGTIVLAGAHNGYFGNLAGNVQAPYVTANDVIGDPLYVGPGDLRLRPGSVMLDAGDNAAQGLPATDLQGHARIQNLTVDIGAYEGTALSPLGLFSDGFESGHSARWR